MSVTVQQVPVDDVKLQAFVGQAVSELGATLGAALIVLGDRLGLYKAMANAGPLSSIELAERTGTAERYVREWLNAQAAGGYVSYDPRSQRYTLPAEQALALADEHSPVFLPGAFQGMVAAVRDAHKLIDAFRTGAGLGWDEHTSDLFGKVPEALLQQNVAFWTLPGSNRQLLCDIRQPAAGVPRSGLGVVYLHGSAWTVLDKDCLTRPLFTHLAAQGHVVMDVAYRLFPETDIPGMVGDARRAVVWLKAHATQYGVNPKRVVLSGASAGGHIAALAAYTVADPELTPTDARDADTSVGGVLCWYAPLDLAACYEHYENAALAEMMPEQPDWKAPPPPMMRRLLGADAERLALQNSPGCGRLDWIVGGTPQQVPQRFAQLSPLFRVHAGCPPTLLMQGSDDLIMPAAPAIALRDKVHALGIKSALLLLPHADHAFDLLATDWSPAARMALWHAERFLAFIAAQPQQCVEPIGEPALVAAGLRETTRHADGEGNV